jgi:hypothetical protein
LHNLQNKDWQRRDVRVRVGLVAMQVTGASCMRGSWDPFAPQPDLRAQKAGRLFLTSLALLTLEVYHRSLLVHRPPDSEPVLPATATDDPLRSTTLTAATVAIRTPPLPPSRGEPLRPRGFSHRLRDAKSLVYL